MAYRNLQVLLALNFTADLEIELLTFGGSISNTYAPHRRFYISSVILRFNRPREQTQSAMHYLQDTLDLLSSQGIASNPTVDRERHEEARRKQIFAPRCNVYPV